MLFDLSIINEQWLGQWEDSNFYLYRYAPRSSPNANTTTEWILGFKENDDDAVSLAAKVVTIILTRDKANFRSGGLPVNMVTIPSHTAFKPNVAGERLCNMVAAAVPWVHHIPNALVRITTVRKSATAPPGQRPTYEEHYDSIRYDGPRFIAGTMLMFDDVYTKGATSDACRDIIIEATNCQQVIGLFLAKTIR